MNSPSEVKARASKLREVLDDMGHQLKHTESLEVISKIEGYADWNTYTAALTKKQKGDEQHSGTKNTEIAPTEPDHSEKPEESEILYCSFCERSQHEVLKLIAGPEVTICDICTDLCVDIVAEEKRTRERER